MSFLCVCSFARLVAFELYRLNFAKKVASRRVVYGEVMAKHKPSGLNRRSSASFGN